MTIAGNRCPQSLRCDDFFYQYFFFGKGNGQIFIVG